MEKRNLLLHLISSLYLFWTDFPSQKNNLAAQKKEEWDLVTQEVHKKEKTRTQSMFRDTC